MGKMIDKKVGGLIKDSIKLSIAGGHLALPIFDRTNLAQFKNGQQ